MAATDPYANGGEFKMNEANTVLVDAGPVLFGIEHSEVNKRTLAQRPPLERAYFEQAMVEFGADIETSGRSSSTS